MLSSLILLISEVRTNTEVLRASAYASIVAESKDFREFLISDDTRVQLFGDIYTGNFPDTDSIDFVKVQVILMNMWNGFDAAYMSFSTGVLLQEEWGRIRRNACFEYPFIQGAIVEENVLRFVSDDFRKYMAGAC